MKRIKQILALLAVLLIVDMYVTTLILAFSHSQAAGKWFIASLAATFLFPTMLYIYLWIMRLLDKKDSEEN